jgi:hypothetical protein
VPALGELAVGTVYGHLHARPAPPRANSCSTTSPRPGRGRWRAMSSRSDDRPAVARHPHFVRS